MAYLAIARKWRPNRFDDLVGQGHVVQTLKNAIQYERVAHAYLFSGARGIGKTSVARIFAKALRCPNAKDAVPCNECPECVSIAESRSVDVVEIDGASNNGVEAVRGIRDNVAYGAASGKYKIYIIDEVHMLSISAFNALLKTLEEPPAHVVFLFATTEVQKIPLTILGRCQRFEFRRLTGQQVVERLRTILATEKVEVSEEGLRLIASYSDGSLRDALSLLDQVLSFFSSQTAAVIDEKKVVEALGVTDTGVAARFISLVIEKKTPELLQLIGETYRSGADLKHFTERCLQELRLVYLVSAAASEKQKVTAEDLDISAIHFQQVKTAADLASLLQLERMAQILNRTVQQLAWSSLPQFLLEMAAVRMTKLDDLKQIEENLLNGKLVIENRRDSHEVPVSVAPPPVVPVVSSMTPPPAPRQMPEPPPPPPPPMERGGGSLSAPNQFENSWKGFVEFVMKKRPLLGALLTHANFKTEPGPQGKVFILAFPEGSFYERQATDPKNFHDIGEALKAFFGKETTFKLSNAVHQAQQSLVQKHEAEVAEIKKTTAEHPTVLQVKEMLGADLIDVQVEL